jgi:hypothetical protein
VPKPPLVCLLILLFGPLMAVEPEVPVAVGTAFRLDYNGGRVALKDGEANHLDGGVEAWYEQVHLQGQALEWTQTPLGGVGQAIIDGLRLTPGPDGFAADRVLVDSRASRLPMVGFRGLLTPQSIVVVRRPADPLDPASARWTVTLAKPGYFAGELLTSGGWAPHAGWAEEIEIEVVADVAGPAISNPRFATIHLLGRQAAQASERVRCRLDRLRQPLARPEDLADAPLSAAEYGIQSLAITMAFDPAGTIDYVVPGQMTTQYGTPPKDTPFRLRSQLDAGR